MVFVQIYLLLYVMTSVTGNGKDSVLSVFFPKLSTGNFR